MTLDNSNCQYSEGDELSLVDCIFLDLSIHLAFLSLIYWISEHKYLHRTFLSIDLPQMLQTLVSFVVSCLRSCCLRVPLSLKLLPHILHSYGRSPTKPKCLRHTLFIGVCRTPMYSTRPVFRNSKFEHRELQRIAINVNVTSWPCDVA